ncbi:hypothetical protein APASM_3895 [Actinosynnema pretiosum subsp. pretiosum]|nr:hypothetical protein APASM_3895 [Actinosynnema pretiosum subsp. pretiosum]
MIATPRRGPITALAAIPAVDGGGVPVTASSDGGARRWNPDTLEPGHPGGGGRPARRRGLAVVLGRR